MQLSSGTQIPDGLLAAIALRNEKPRLGVPSWNPALHQGIDASNSTIVLGLQSTAALNRIGSRSTGKERDAESGLDYFGARYYGSNMGRFMSPDWASKPEAVPYSSLANPQSLNLYSYVLNNPLSKADPDGHCGTEDGTPCSKNLSVTQVTNIVVNETQSLHGSDVKLSDAHQSVAHAIINGDNAKGANRPSTASDKVSPANQQTQAYKDTKADVQCACQEAAKGVDPTNGSQNFNLRPNDSTTPFQGADIQTQSGPFTNSFPSKDLPATGIYVNTYKQPTPAPKPTPPPPPKKEPQ